jgi:divalent metal cation (Fe/Co/Zn/Cd) transporter
MSAGATVLAPYLRKALQLEYFTISWNLLEAVVAIGAGVAAGSIALVGFGFDSSIEGFAASVVIWQLRARTTKSASAVRSN